MRRLVIASAVLASASLALAGCATGSSFERHDGPRGTLVGAVALPQGASADAVCNNLVVRAVTSDGQATGDVSVHIGHNRCLYTVDYVKAGVPVQLQIKANAARVCSSGTLAPSDQPKAVELQNMETVTLDTTLHCA